ncbi:MAG: alpha-2-macroglobulin family protein, partial [Anaerolineae bacterium]
RPANGQGSLRTAFSQEFTTVFRPQIIGTQPGNGDTRAAPGGGVSFQFASPINPASLVSGTITIVPKPTAVYTTYVEWDNTLYLNMEKLPDTDYTITLSGKIADPYGNLLGRDYVLRFTTRQYDPFVQLYSTGPVGTYNAYTPTVAAVAYRNVPQISFGLWKLSDEEFIALAGQNFWNKWRAYTPKQADLVREWQVATTAPRNQIGTARVRLEDRDGQPLAPGLYYLAVDSETIQGEDRNETPGAQRQLIARTTANVTLKTWAGGALAWVTDLKSGQPLAGAKVRFSDGLGIEVSATTNRDGIAEATFDPPRQPWQTLLALVRTADGGFGVASSAWTSGIGPWDFRISSDTSPEPYRGIVYTDRPIYRPGQTVYWKAIIRRDRDALYELPTPGQVVTVTVNDGEGKTLWRRPMTLDGMGALNGAFELDLDAALGYYEISVWVPNPKPTKEREGTYIGAGFAVAEYRKPEYEVSAQTDRPEYTQGEQIRVTVQANYFFGQPVKGAKVRWTLLSNDFAFQLPATDDRPGGPYSFADWDWYEAMHVSRFGEALSQGEAVTDAEGRATFTVPADITKFDQSQRFTFDITILDVNGQSVSTQTAAIVHKAAFYIGLRPQSYVSVVNKPAAIDVLTVDPQGKSVPATPVELIASRIRWYSVRERAEDGNYYWTSKAEKTPVFTQTVTTGNDGTAVFTFTPNEAGEYKVEATGRDPGGHFARSATYVWVSGPGYAPWRQENNDRIQLIPDKKEYKPGETARLLVASPYQTPVKALLTVERGGILTRTVMDIRGNSETIELPIRPEFAPDVFVSLFLVKGIDAASPAPSFRMGLAELKVSVADKQLQVVLVPRAEGKAPIAAGPLRVGPREKMTWEVRTLDAAGKPVSAEVSLALVDKAVLSLAESPEGDLRALLNRFYHARDLGVITAATLVMNVDRLLAQLPEGGKGGGGGGGEIGEMTVRREFPDTAYWNAAVRTGPDGRAQVELTLPDNLTTWTMDARAVTADTRVGQARLDVIAAKDLLVRPVLPRFFIAGDQAEIAAIVHNNTAAAAEVEVKLAASGVQVAAATQRKATIVAGDTARVAWPVTVGGDATQVVVTMSAAGTTGGSSLQDAVEITLPVHRYTTPETVGSSGQVALGESRLELVRVPVGADRTAGELEVRLEASLAAGMTGGLTYLKHYPYECTEQTVSRFLPNVVSYQALKKLGIATSGDLETVLAQQVGVGLQRLYAGQHVDGGWGWWPKDESNATISSYVVLGMAKARQAGFAIDETVLARGVRYLKGQLKAPASLKGSPLNEQAFILYALAEAGANEPNRAGALYEQRERLSLYAKGYLALALGLMNDAASKTRLQTLLADLTSRAITSGTATHWEEAWPDYLNMNSDTRTTAILLDVLARHAADHSLAPNAVRWLMTARRADRWETTQENAWAIIALTDWMAA